VVKLFFLLSGEHPTLPFSELRAILEAEGYAYKVLEKMTQVLRLEADENCVGQVASRAALTRVCSLELFKCEANFVEILEHTQSTPLGEVLRPHESFVVRVKRVAGAAPHLNRAGLERKLGEIILNTVEKSRVSLKAPQKTFFGVLTENKFVFGLKLADVSPKAFVERNPKRKPFFHPSAMPAKLARCMVNLARPRAGDLVLDPFCGTASMLIEAALIGCRVVGCDVKRHMVKGSLRNLLHFNVEPEGLAVADARALPFTRADCVVTDPPYGRSATTMGSATERVVHDFLHAVADTLRRGGRICMAAPKTVCVGKIGEELGYKRLESHFVYIHRSLIREIVVFERV